MKKSRKRLIAWMLAAVMALTSGSGAAFADEVQTEGDEAVGETVNVEAEQPEVNTEDGNTEISPEDENTGVSPEDGNTVDGEKQTEETDNARLGEESKESDSAVYVDYVGYAERAPGSYEVFPGETISYTARVYRFEYNPESEESTSTRIYDYTVEWNVVQIDDESEGENIINEYTILSSKESNRLDIKVNKTSPASHFAIHPTFRRGDEEIEHGWTHKSYVKKELLSVKITNNPGYIEPSLPGDSADYFAEVSWKKFDAASGKVSDMDTSKVSVTWDVVLHDDQYDKDTINKLSDYVSYEVDADNPNLLHFKINEKWVDEDRNVKITVTASVGDEGLSESDFVWIHLFKEVNKFETDECWAEAGSVIYIDELNPKAKRYNNENPQGIDDERYSFKFLDVYEQKITDGSVPLEDVTVSPDGKTLTVPKVKEGRYIVCINADNGITLPTQFYAPIYVVNKDAAETTDNAAAGRTDGSDNDSKSDKDSAKTGDDTSLAVWLALMLLAGAGTAGTALYTRKKRTTE